MNNKISFSTTRNNSWPLNLTLTAKPLHIVKVSNVHKTYPELQIFKQQLVNHPCHLSYSPYSTAKKKISFYKSIFLSLSLIFFLLAGIVLMKTSALSLANIYSGYFLKMKHMLVFFCLSLSGFSLLIYGTLQPKKEAACSILRKALHKLDKAYELKILERQLGDQVASRELYQNKQFLKHTWRETRDIMQDQTRETEELLEKIQLMPTITLSDKERLCNLSVLELKDNLDAIIHETFRSSWKSKQLPSFRK